MVATELVDDKLVDAVDVELASEDADAELVSEESRLVEAELVVEDDEDVTQKASLGSGSSCQLPFRLLLINIFRTDGITRTAGVEANVVGVVGVGVVSSVTSI